MSNLQILPGKSRSSGGVDKKKAIVVIIILAAVITAVAVVYMVGIPSIIPLPKTGDFNGDGVVDMYDFERLGGYLAYKGIIDTGDYGDIDLSQYKIIYADPDVNNDGVLDENDLEYFGFYIMGVPGYETLYP